MAINIYGSEPVTGERASRRLFITVQASKAAIGVALGLPLGLILLTEWQHALARKKRSPSCRA